MIERYPPYHDWHVVDQCYWPPLWRCVALRVMVPDRKSSLADCPMYVTPRVLVLKEGIDGYASGNVRYRPVAMENYALDSLQFDSCADFERWAVAAFTLAPPYHIAYKEYHNGLP